ncbi:MAG: discoidin domain-containing protein, partial [Chloroflexi bacterium]|nr:discoidin domain-containing protein [Chloroflexota bacterium]
GSTDPVGHGPDNLFFQMYSKYWSHNQFPTWIQLDLGRPELIEGIVFFGYTPRSTPRDFQVLASEDGQEWRLILQETGNEEQYFIQAFEPVKTRFVKVVILSDNGNNNVALTGVAVLRKQAGPIAVSDWRSFSAGNLPALVFDRGWKIPEAGWVVVDLGGDVPQEIVVEFTGIADHCAFTLLGSDEL